MLFVIIVIALFVVLDLAAMHWGSDSRESISRPLWERQAYSEKLFANHQA